MVSLSCKIIAKTEAEKLGLNVKSVKLGEVEIKEKISVKKRNQLNVALQTTGLQLLNDKRSITVEKIRTLIIEMVHYSDELPKTNISCYISEKLHHNYSALSHLFSEVRGTSIEHYIIVQKIERVKELITYDELSFSEIAFKLHYSNVAHLSRQFKKITGLTPKDFKNMEYKKRIPLGLL